MGRKNRGHEKKLIRLDRRASRLERRAGNDYVTYGGFSQVLARRLLADHTRRVRAQRCRRCWPRGWEILATLEDESADFTA